MNRDTQSLSHLKGSRHYNRPGRRLAGAIFSASMLGAIASAPPAPASVDLGTAASYAVVELGSGRNYKQNSGPVIGNVILGNGVNADFGGGNDGQITGTLFYDSTVTGISSSSSLDTPPTTAQVSTAVTNRVLLDAGSAASAAAAFAPTQTFSTISGTTTISGNGGRNVINVGSISNAVLTLNGTADDYFIFNVSSSFATNQPMTLSGGVQASHVLFNFTATSGTVFQTAAGNQVYGTFLAASGGNFLFSSLRLDGALINTAGTLQFVSGSRFNSFAPFASVPEPSTWILLGLGLGFVPLYRATRPRGPRKA